MRRGRLDPYTTERREPMELLARLAGRSNYLVPTQGHSTAASRLTTLDVAHAIGTSAEKLGATVALAIACQRPWDWPVVHAAAYPRLLDDLREQRSHPGIVDGGLKFRARIVLYDAFHDLVRPAARRRWRDAIDESGVPDRAYRFIHKTATGLLQAAANSASRDACVFLFAPEGSAALADAPTSRHAIVLASDQGEIRVWHAPDLARLAADVGAALRDDDAAIAYLALLVRDAVQRGATRAAGALSLRGDLHAVTYVGSGA